MIYLSKILVERPRPPSLYDWHQLLWELFDAPPDSPRPFLFRVEHSAAGRSQALMQSEYAPPNSTGAPRILAIRDFAPHFRTGQQLRFRVCANPVKSIRDDQGRTNSKGEIKQCRVPLVIEDEQLAWLARKLAGAARLDEAVIQARHAFHFRTRGKRAAKIVAVTFDGSLRVTDGECLLGLIRSGIGPAKGFGCGLLSLARG